MSYNKYMACVWLFSPFLQKFIIVFVSHQFKFGSNAESQKIRNLTPNFSCRSRCQRVRFNVMQALYPHLQVACSYAACCYVSHVSRQPGGLAAKLAWICIWAAYLTHLQCRVYALKLDWASADHWFWPELWEGSLLCLCATGRILKPHWQTWSGCWCI